jgi:aryl-alcohol dehydrogenase-like predicted oxidoreductase
MIGQRSLGDSGIWVPELGLALASLARTGLFAVPDAEVIEFLRNSLDRGASLFAVDRHCGEGRGLRLLGQALQGEPGGQVALRLGRDAETCRRFGPAQLRTDLEEALRVLGRPRLDLLVLDRPPVELAPELAQAAQALARSGLLGAWGARVEGEAEGRAWLKAPGLGFLEVTLNALDPRLAGLGPLAARAGKGLLATSPLAGGWLAGHHKAGFWELPHFRLGAEQEADLARRNAAIQLHGTPGATRAQAALQWVLAQPGVSGVLCGARTRAQLDDAVSADAILQPQI